MLTVWVGRPLRSSGVGTLRRRGDRWPVGRTLAFVVVGMGSFVVRRPRPGWRRYDTTLLSVHMVQHMILSMVVPLSLALGAPVTLALRTLPPRPAALAAGGAALAGGEGADLPAAHLRALRRLAVGALLLRLVRRDAALDVRARADARAPGLVGCLFFWPLVGIDPVPGPGGLPVPDAAGRADAAVPRLPRRHDHGPDRRCSAATGTPRCARDRWARGCPTPLDDQHLAGGHPLGARATWSALVFFGVLFVQWVRVVDAEAAREDRRLDRLEARRAARRAARRRAER